MRIDGYYYKIFQSDKERISIYFLYNNGIIYNLGTVYLTEIDNVVEINRIAYYARKYKYSWGVFQIDSNKIKYEKWVPVEGALPTVTYEGEINNDTTFTIKEFYDIKNSQKVNISKVDWTFHFKEFNPKPDSTNTFVK